MKKQPSIKLTPAQLKMKAVLKPIVEGIINEASEITPEQLKILESITRYTNWISDVNRNNTSQDMDKYKQLILKLVNQL